MNCNLAIRLGLLVLLPTLVYLNSFGNPFHYDDVHSITENPNIRSLANIPAFFSDPTLFSESAENAMYRPLLLTTYAVNYTLAGYQVWAYHLVQVLLHIASALLVFAIGRRLLGEERAALVAGVIFALHPIATELVNYISSRSELLAGVFVLLGLWGFLRYRAGSGGLFVILAAYSGALLSKSVAIAFPAVLLCHDLIFRRQRLRGEGRFYGFLAGISAVYIAMSGRLLTTAALDAPVRPYSEQLWSQLKALVLYLKLLSVPYGMSVDHQFLISDSLFDPFAATALMLAVSILLLAATIHIGPRGLPLFLLAWAALSLAPASIVPLNVLVNEHRLYLPSASFALGLAAILKRQFCRAASQSVLVLSIGFVLVLSMLTAQRNSVWQDVYHLWGDAASKAPLMARPHIYLAEAYADDGLADRSIAEYEIVLARDPGFIEGYLRLGQLYDEGGMAAEAEETLRKALENDGGGDARVWGEMGELYRHNAQRAAGLSEVRFWFEKSAEAYEEAVRLSPDNPAFLNNLGNTYQELGMAVRAVSIHERASQFDPDDSRTYLNLANARRLSGDSAGARRDYRKALELDPEYAEAWLSLGAMLESAGQLPEAMEAFRRAATIDSVYEAFVRNRRIEK